MSERTAGAAPGPTVLQVLPALAAGGGVERGTLDLTRYLARAGWRPVVASAGGGLVGELRRAGAEHVELPLDSKNPARIAANVGRLATLIRERGVRLVHARSRAPAWSASYAAARCAVPLVTTFHSVYGGHDNPAKRRYNAVMASGARAIAISDYVAEHMREAYGVGDDRLRVVPRGVDVTAFDPERVNGTRINALAERWGVEPGRRVVMLPGRLAERKGHLLLLRAVAKLARADDFLVLFVGPFDEDDGHVKRVRRAISALSLADRVRLVGVCDDMPAAYRLADVVAVPSVTPEAFGRVSAEAQAMGVPVVVTDTGGLGETLQPASTGWLVAPDEPDELAEAVRLALAMPPDVRARLAERARGFVARELSAEQMCRRTVQVYRELLPDAPAIAVRDALGAVSVPARPRQP